MNTTTINFERRLNNKINEGNALLTKKYKEFEQSINDFKILFIQKLKDQNLFVEHCPERGYIYRIVQSVDGLITRVTIGWKNGYLSVMDMEPVDEVAA